MTSSRRTLGTLLRHLIELLDGAVEQGYVEAGLEFRPRYTPVLKALMSKGPVAIKTLAETAGLTHSAASQTVAQMKKAGLVEVRRGRDQREQVVFLTLKATDMIPAIQDVWRITNQAANDLEAELGFPLSQRLEDAIALLEAQSFSERRRTAAQRLEVRVP